MTNREIKVLEQLEAKINALIERQDKREQVTDSIYRALYGDELNATRGLVARQKEDDKNQEAREKRDVKIDLLLEGMVASVGKNTAFRKKATKFLWIGGTVGLGGGGTVGFWDTIKGLAHKMF
jgi:hypothetical protein